MRRVASDVRCPSRPTPARGAVFPRRRDQRAAALNAPPQPTCRAPPPSACLRPRAQPTRSCNISRPGRATSADQVVQHQPSRRLPPSSGLTWTTHGSTHSSLHTRLAPRLRPWLRLRVITPSPPRRSSAHLTRLADGLADLCQHRLLRLEQRRAVQRGQPSREVRKARHDGRDGPEREEDRSQLQSWN